MDVRTQRALAHPKRTEILGYLTHKRDEEGTDADELSDSLDLAAAQVKYHLTVLCDAHLISHTDDLQSGAVGRYVAVPAGKW
jgi:predicted ArsR family transcriptional regulator